MITTAKDNAFPIFTAEGECIPPYKGLTKREYFAALAMQGLLASGADLNSRALASEAVEHADQLVKYLNS